MIYPSNGIEKTFIRVVVIAREKNILVFDQSDGSHSLMFLGQPIPFVLCEIVSPQVSSRMLLLRGFFFFFVGGGGSINKKIFDKIKIFGPQIFA